MDHGFAASQLMCILRLAILPVYPFAVTS